MSSEYDPSRHARSQPPSEAHHELGKNFALSPTPFENPIFQRWVDRIDSDILSITENKSDELRETIEQADVALRVLRANGVETFGLEFYLTDDKLNGEQVYSKFYPPKSKEYQLMKIIYDQQKNSLWCQWERAKIVIFLTSEEKSAQLNEFLQTAITKLSLVDDEYPMKDRGVGQIEMVLDLPKSTRPLQTPRLEDVARRPCPNN